MKLLEINAVYGHGSTGNIIKEIEKHCENSKIECYIASPDPNVYKANRSYRIGNFVDHKIHAFLSRFSGKQAYFSKRATKKFIRWIEKIKPDIIHLHNLHSNYLNIILLLDYISANNIKTVITLHDCWFFTGGCFHYNSSKCIKWQTNCFNCPRKHKDSSSYFFDASSKILKDRIYYLNKIPQLIVIGASKWISEEFKKSLISASQVDYIHNGFDINIFKPRITNLKEKYNLEDKYIILGPVSKWKAKINKSTLDYFIKYMKEDEVLILFGKNSDNKTISHPRVIEFGEVTNPLEMAQLYSIADVMVNCSREDTFPSINIEALACGTPVITYDSTGCKETINGVCGRAIKTGDYIQLFEEVKRIRSIGKNNLSSDCIKWVKENFESNIAYNKYINLFRSFQKSTDKIT